MAQLIYPPIRHRWLARRPGPAWLGQPRSVALITILTLSLIPFFVQAFVRAEAPGTQPGDNQPARLARLSERVSIRAAGRGNPTINLSDGHEVLTSYVGPEELRVALEQNLAQPLSLASADFDEDGVPDLVSGYAYNGQGIVSMLRGNVDSIYPNAPEAKQRKAEGTFTNAPFLSPAQVFAAPLAADFIGAGDFDADGHWDIVLASRGGDRLFFMPGDGTGNFAQTLAVPLNGTVSAFTTGEINRADGLTDIVVGIDGPRGKEALVFEGPQGALKSQPEEFDLSATATSFALGQFDEHYAFDLAVAAGNDLVIIQGRDRKLSLDWKQQAEVSPARRNSRSFNFTIRSIAAGNFGGDPTEDLALLADDGRVHFLNQSPIGPGEKNSGRPQRQWQLETVSDDVWPNATQLLCAQVSTAAWDDLLVLDTSARKLHAVSRVTSSKSRAAQDSDNAIATAPRVISLEVTGEPLAALPMRLDVDALSDLVVLKSGSSAATVVPTVPQSEKGTRGMNVPEAIGVFSNPATITINNTGPTPIKATPYPSTITIAGQTGTINHLRLRLNNFSHSLTDCVDVLLVGPTGEKAIVMSDVMGTAGSTLLTFDDQAASFLAEPIVSGSYKPTDVDSGPADSFPSPAPAGPYASVLAAFNGTDPNGTWSLYVVEDNPIFGGIIANGWSLIIDEPPPLTFVVINANDSGAGSLRQAILDANFNPGADIISFNIPGSGSHTIAPASALPDIADVVTIDGTTQPGFAGTPIIEIDGSNTGPFAGQVNGVLNVAGGRSTIRGLVINRYNTDGIALLDNGNNIIEGNFIGTDVTGTIAQGVPLTGGIAIDTANNLIGGTTTAARNLVSGLAQAILFTGYATQNAVAGNYIGLNADGLAIIPNSDAGVSSRNGRGSPNNTVGGTTAGARNVISGGVFPTGVDWVYSGTQGCLVQGNFIGTDATGMKAFSPGDWSNEGNSVGVNLEGGAHDNTIGGTTPAARNIISGNKDGLFFRDSATSGNLIQGNFIGTNKDGLAALANSVGLRMIFDASLNTIGGDTPSTRNIISGNTFVGVQLGEPTKGGALNNLVQGNYIGTDVSGDGPLGNGQSANFGDLNAGIKVPANARGDRIEGNRIAYNKAAGIRITNVTGGDIASIEIFIVDNLIYANEGLGIDLGASGITPNDPLDADDGPNLLQNFPVLTSAVPAARPETLSRGAVAGELPLPDPIGADAVTINGSLNSTPNTTYTVHWYFSADAQCITNQAASRPLVFGRVPGVTTDNSGNAAFNFPFDFPAGTNSGIINCTATDPQGNTSEFSACFAVGTGVPTPTPTPTPSPTATPTPTPGCSATMFTPNQSIPDNNVSGVNIPLVVGGQSGTISDLNVRLDSVTHTWVGDLKVRLTAPGSVVSSVLVDRPGVPASSFGCSADNFINTVLDDEAGGGSIENLCTNGMTGTFTPNDQLSVFDGLSPNGTWTLNVSDSSIDDTGIVQSVSLIICTNASPTPTPTPSPAVQFNTTTYSAPESTGSKALTVTRTGSTSGVVTVNYATSDGAGLNGCYMLNTGYASSRCDFETTMGTLSFAAGETSKTISIPIIDDSFAEGNENFIVTLSNATGATLGAPSTITVTITDNESATGANPIQQAGFFARLHYYDFLNREPDASGLAFWTNEIAQCGTNAACLEIKRINVSAAFYLSIEFQGTGYLVERIYRAAYGNATGTSTFGGTHQLAVPMVRFNEFLPDTQQMGQGVVVGQTGWELVLENNKQVFLTGFVQRTRFATAFPASMTAAQFVDTLNSNAGNALSLTERNQLVTDLQTNAKTRAQVLRAVAEDADLSAAESNRAFVLMQFFGYLRRNPNDSPDSDYTGYDFWLRKLNEFYGNFVNAEMVKAFIVSGEYQGRFGP